MGIQQKVGVYWIYIYVHYDKHRRSVSMPSRFLDSKWGIIKHDVLKFISVHAKVVRLNRSSTSTADSYKERMICIKSKTPKV